MDQKTKQSILRDLRGDLSYDEIAARHNVSRGTVWRIAVEHGARKHEKLILEREGERRARQESFLKEVINATHKMDVLDFMAGLPDGSVSMHLTSPPYNIGKQYGNAASADRSRFHFYLGWLLQVLSEMDRTLAPGVVWCEFIGG